LGKPEDARYLKIRQNNEPNFRYKSAYIIFGLQSILAWIVGSILFIAIENNQLFNLARCFRFFIDIIGYRL
jgi:steroid 5-alpha reductase family enzyme